MHFGSAFIVEDNLASARILRQCLLSIGFAPVYDAADVNEALAIMEELDEAPKLCLVDYHLGGRDGLHFIRTMRQTYSSDEMRIFLVTADDSVELEKKAQKLNVNGVIHKPFTAKSLGLALLKDTLPA